MYIYINDLIAYHTIRYICQKLRNSFSDPAMDANGWRDVEKVEVGVQKGRERKKKKNFDLINF